MKVLHVIPSVSPVRGGPSQAVLEMVKVLRETGIDTEIATTNDHGTELLNVPLRKRTDYQQVPVWFFSRFSPPISAIREFRFSYDFTIWLWQNIHNYELLHIHTIFCYTSTMAMIIAQWKKVPYIVRPCGMLCEWSLQQKKLKKELYLSLIEKTNLNHSISIHFTSISEQQEAAPLNLASANFIIPHGLTIPNTIPDANQRLRQHFNLPLDQPIILFLSRLHPKKGLDYLIPALGKLSDYRFAFIIAGSGDPEYETEVKTLVKTHGIEQETHFTGFVKGEIKDLLIQGSDIFALTSYSENFGISVLEALGAGLPVLVTPGVALSDIIQQNQIGYVTELDVDAISTTIQRFLDNHKLAEKMGASYGSLRYRARQFILDNYTWDKIALKMVSVYEDIISRTSCYSKLSSNPEQEPHP
ncbi:MAG: glycosyltransferase [Dolichospermum sp.]